jgi:hypothetical protein
MPGDDPGRGAALPRVHGHHRLAARAALALLALLPIARARAEEWTVYADRKCGFSFSYPPAWNVVRTGSCAIGLRPRNWTRVARNDPRELHDSVIEIRLVKKNFAAAARDAHFFTVRQLRAEWKDPEALSEYAADAWVLCGPDPCRNPARSLGLRGTRSLIATGDFRTYNKGGGYAGLAYFRSAVVNDRKSRSVVLQNYVDGYEYAFERVAKSVRFVP